MSLIALAVVTVNISAGIANERLTDFGKETGLQMLYDYQVMGKYRTNAVSGRMDAFVALDRMIEGTPVRYDYVNKRTVTLKAVEPVVVKTPKADDAWTRILIADECSFGLISAQTAAAQLGEVPQSCWCCAGSQDSSEASCIALPSTEACSVYDSHEHRDFWTSAETETIDEITVSGEKD